MLDQTKEVSKKDLAIAAARKSFAAACKAFDPDYEMNWHHRIIANKLQEVYERVEKGETVFLAIFTPPRHGKSRQVTQLFPAWVLGKDPKYPIVTASYSQDLATDFGQLTRDIMRSARYSEIFNTKLRQDTTAKSHWLTEEGGGYTAVGRGGALTGRGFKIGIIDDPFKNREEADSQTIRDSAHKWYQSTFYTRRQGPSAIILILTRWHDDDLAGRILDEDKDNKWEVLSFPAISNGNSEHRSKGEALWESRFPLEFIEETKEAIGPYEFSSLYQQTPVTDEARELRHEWIQRRTDEDIKHLTLNAYATIDTAMTKKTSSDATGIVVNFVDRDNNWHIKSYEYRVAPDELIALLFKLAIDYKLQSIGIEKTAFLYGLKPAIEQEMAKRNVFFNIIELEHNQVNKETRIRGLIPRYSAGKIYHLGDNRELEEQMAAFPKGRHDDVLDALAYQLQVAKPPQQYNYVQTGEPIDDIHVIGV